MFRFDSFDHRRTGQRAKFNDQHFEDLIMITNRILHDNDVIRGVK